MKKTIDERAEEYASRVHLSEGYRGDVVTAYCVGCSEQDEEKVRLIENEIYMLSEDTGQVQDSLECVKLYSRIDGLKIALELIRLYPNPDNKHHAQRYLHKQ